jgi:magnesium transporter
MITRYEINGFDWIDVLAPTDADLETIARDFNIPHTLIVDSIEAGHLPKYENIDDLIFLMFRIYDKTSKPNADTASSLTEKISVFYRDKHIISIHRDEIDFITKMIKRNSCKDIFELLLYFIQNSVSSFERKINSITTAIEIIENHLFGPKNPKHVLQDLYRIKKQVYVIDKILDLNIDLIPNILEDKHLNKSLLQNIKESNDKLQFKTSNIIDNINNIINIHLAIESNKANDIMKILTIITLFFLPASLIVGIYGMNFKIPEYNYAHGYEYFWLLLIGLEVIIFFLAKQKKWF